jgi:hypothetical protein
MTTLLSIAFLLLPVASVNAQDMSPPKEVAALGWMVGTWNGSGKMAFGANETDVTTDLTVSFDGQFLKIVSTDKSSGFTLTKTAMTGWDASKHQYINYTFTNISPSARIEHGTLDGTKLVMVSDPWEAEGMKLVSRETMSKVSDSKFELIVEAKIGEKWEKEMDFVLTKK